MVGSLPVPSKLIINSNGPDVVARRLVLRNISNNALVIKLVSSNSSGAVNFSNEHLRISGRSVLYVEMHVDKTKLGSTYLKPVTVSGYVACIEPYNLEDLQQWMNKKGAEFKHQKAFSLTLEVSSKFSAYETVVDLPGAASLVEPVRFATAGVDVSDTVTARSLEFDTITARGYGSQTNFVRDLKDKNAASSCWLVDIASRYLGVQEPVKNDRSVKSKKSGKPAGNSQKSVKSGSRKSCGTEVKPAHSEYFNAEMNVTPCAGN